KRAPVRAAIAASNSRTHGPVVSQPDSSTAVTASISCVPRLGVENGMNAAVVRVALLTDRLPIHRMLTLRFEVPRVYRREDRRPRQGRTQRGADAQDAMRGSQLERRADREPIASCGLGTNPIGVDPRRPR